MQASRYESGDLSNAHQGHTRMHWLWVIIVGLVVGIIAKAVTPGKEAMGWIITAILGIAGSFISTFVGEKLGWWPEAGFMHFIGSIIGAVVLLVIYHALFRRGANS
jgi:uncharacterized membrane protein YeaQ/YmgE (transglycosylase-associated protein family)